MLTTNGYKSYEIDKHARHNKSQQIILDKIAALHQKKAATINKQLARHQELRANWMRQICGLLYVMITTILHRIERVRASQNHTSMH